MVVCTFRPFFFNTEPPTEYSQKKVSKNKGFLNSVFQPPKRDKLNLTPKNKIMKINPFIAIDLETTDLDPTVGEIVEIGAVYVNEDLSIRGEFQAYVKPSTEYRNPRAMEVNGISEEALKEAKLFTEVMVDFEKWRKEMTSESKTTFASWNVAFDSNFLKEQCKKFGVVCPIAYSPLDLKSMAVWELAKRDIRFYGGLSACMDQVGLSFEGKEHSALDDIKNSLRVVKYLYEKEKDQAEKSSQATQ